MSYFCTNWSTLESLKVCFFSTHYPCQFSPVISQAGHRSPRRILRKPIGCGSKLSIFHRERRLGIKHGKEIMRMSFPPPQRLGVKDSPDQKVLQVARPKRLGLIDRRDLRRSTNSYVKATSWLLHSSHKYMSVMSWEDQ